MRQNMIKNKAQKQHSNKKNSNNNSNGKQKEKEENTKPNKRETRRAMEICSTLAAYG